MMFAKRLRDGVRRGEITTSVRIWLRPRVRVGTRYRMEEGENIYLIRFHYVPPRTKPNPTVPKSKPLTKEIN